jgi:hypothetical protein
MTKKITIPRVTKPGIFALCSTHEDNFGTIKTLAGHDVTHHDSYLSDVLTSVVWKHRRKMDLHFVGGVISIPLVAFILTAMSAFVSHTSYFLLTGRKVGLKWSVALTAFVNYLVFIIGPTFLFTLPFFLRAGGNRQDQTKTDVWERKWNIVASKLPRYFSTAFARVATVAFVLLVAFPSSSLLEPLELAPNFQSIGLHALSVLFSASMWLIKHQELCTILWISRKHRKIRPSVTYQEPMLSTINRECRI